MCYQTSGRHILERARAPTPGHNRKPRLRDPGEPENLSDDDDLIQCQIQHFLLFILSFFGRRVEKENSFFHYVFIYICLCVREREKESFACMYVSAPHACSAHRGQKMASGALEP